MTRKARGGGGRWPLPAYVQARMDFDAQRREHKRNPPPGCECELCAPGAGRRLLGDKLDAQSERNGPAPF